MSPYLWGLDKEWYAPLPDMVLDIFQMPNYVYLASLYNDRWQVKAYLLITALLYCFLTAVGIILFSINVYVIVFLVWFAIHLYTLMMFSILLGVLHARWRHGV